MIEEIREMIDGDLTYHIEYPSEWPEERYSNGEKNSAVCDKVPVVILFGWAGSKDKHLVKYSRIYENQRCIILRCRTSPRVLTYRLDRLPKLAEKFLDLLHEKSLDKHPIIFHIFSNGGTFFYQHVSLEMQKKKTILPIKGVIFDSALHRRRFSTLYRGLSNSLGGPLIFNVPLSFCVGLVVMAWYILWPFIKASIELKKPEVVDIILDEEPFTWPQLLIYSKTDDLNPWEDVEKFSQRREEKNVKITKLCFEDSPHVQHLIYHREIYINTVLDFMKTCLSSDNKV